MAGQQTDTDSVKAQAELREDIEASRTRTTSSKDDDVGHGRERVEITEEDVWALMLLPTTSAFE
jgi:hypothetical protein